MAAKFIPQIPINSLISSVGPNVICEYKLLTPPTITFFSQGVNMGVVLHQLERQRQSKEMEQLVSPTSNVTTATITRQFELTSLHQYRP